MAKKRTTVEYPVMKPINEEARYLGARIFISRLHNRLTIGDLAHRISMDVDTLNAIEHGAQEVSFDELEKISCVTKKDIHFFTGHNDHA